jgi:hypothetical protein
MSLRKHPAPSAILARSSSTTANNNNRVSVSSSSKVVPVGQIRPNAHLLTLGSSSSGGTSSRTGISSETAVGGQRQIPAARSMLFAHPNNNNMNNKAPSLSIPQSSKVNEAFFYSVLLHFQLTILLKSSDDKSEYGKKIR